MKNLILLATLVLSFSIQAVTFEITNICDNSPALKEEVEIILPTNVLKFSEYMMKNYMIPHQVTENGVISILDTKTGYDAYEFLSESHMRVYGWCYEINGEMPAVEAGSYTIDPKCEDTIRWFYGYAEVVNGIWTEYCRPVYLNTNPFICSKQ